jgi:hypothetical protein
MSFYDDASLIMFPSGYKEDKIYSLKPTDGSGDLTFTRASSATRVNEQGLIEGVRTNVALHSNGFSNAAWGKVSSGVGSVPIVTANYTTAPGSASFTLSNNDSNTVTITSTEWVRLSTIRTAATTLYVARIGLFGNAPQSNTLDISIAFAQLETGDIATEYIPTTTTAVSVGMLANVPRIDYTGGGCGKLLLEPQRTTLYWC